VAAGGLPDREEDGGDYRVAIPRRYEHTFERIQSYRYAGGRFPVLEFTEYFSELRAIDVITEEDHQNLMKWVAYESLPTAKREAMKAASAYRPITDLPAITQFKHLLSDFADDETDALDDSDVLAISLSRREANRVLEVLDESQKNLDDTFQILMGKFRRSLDPGTGTKDSDPQ